MSINPVLRVMNPLLFWPYLSEASKVLLVGDLSEGAMDDNVVVDDHRLYTGQGLDTGRGV